MVERFIRTIKNGIHDRVRFTNGEWQDMLKFVINQYNRTKHSSTNHTPKEAHDDKNSPYVIANLTMKSVNTRKYKNISVGDEVKVYTKGTDNAGSRKESKSRWSDRTYKVVDIDRDMMLNTYYVLEGSNRHVSRHELLLVS